MATVEKRAKNKWRISKMYKGTRYRTTIECLKKPSPYEADNIIDRIIKHNVPSYPANFKENPDGKIIRRCASVISPYTKTQLYYILNEEDRKVKIGVSTNPIARIRDLKTACGAKLQLLHSIEFDNRLDCFTCEAYSHRYFAKYRKHNSEWFDSCIVDSLLNCFYTDADIRMDIERIKEANNG